MRISILCTDEFLASFELLTCLLSITFAFMCFPLPLHIISTSHKQLYVFEKRENKPMQKHCSVTMSYHSQSYITPYSSVS